MNRIFIYLFLSVLSVCSLSCDSYLETKTFGQILPETTEDYVSLLNKHLSDIESGWNNQIVGNYQDVARLESFTDNVNASLDRSPRPSFYVWTYAGKWVNNASWRFSNQYFIIKDLNIILEHVSADESEFAKKVVATCYAMRGVIYYNMMRELCQAYDVAKENEIPGMPIVDCFDMEAKPGRGNIRSTLNFVVENLQKAISMEQNDPTFLFTADVAKVYLARAYFWGQDWENAARVASEVLAKYPLVEGDAFREMTMARAPYKKLPGNVIFASWAKGKVAGNWGYTSIMKDLRNRPLSFELIRLFSKDKDKDIRYRLYFDKEFRNTKEVNCFIRGAEMCLTAAECYAHLGFDDKALDLLNSLRSKRISDYHPLTLANLPSVDPQALIKVDATGAALTPLIYAILSERQKEFYMEGDRWWELKRNGSPEFWVGYNGVKYSMQKYLYTYPFAKGDLLVNPKLEQNPGYENL